MSEPLTDKFARAADAGVHFDADRRSPRGFMLRVTPAGARSWCLNYRLKDTGRERRITIGDVAAWPIAEARKRAAELRRIVDAGGDPLGEREERRREPTVAELWERFAAEELPKLAEGTRIEYEAMAQNYVLPTLGRAKVSAVARDDVGKLHYKITTEGKSIRANRVKSLCSVLFAHALVWNMRADNPCQHVKGNTEHRRERYLDEAETARLMAEIDRRRSLGGHWVDSCDKTELAIYTGARRAEILRMMWGQLEGLDGAATWVLPSSSTKEGKRTGRSKRLPLSPDAVAVLQRRRAEREAGGKVVRLSDDYVFRGGDSKAGINAWERDWFVMRAAVGLDDVRLHDLRHSYASLLVSEGLSLEIIGKLLGHSRIQTTQRYAHLAAAPLRAATELVARKVRR
jgi:integrase